MKLLHITAQASPVNCNGDARASRLEIKLRESLERTSTMGTTSQTTEPKKTRKKSVQNKFTVAIRVTKVLEELPPEDRAWVLNALVGELPKTNEVDR